MLSVERASVCVFVAILINAVDAMSAGGDDRLLDPGSPEELSPGALEGVRTKSEEKALNAQIKNMHDRRKAFHSDPHKAARALQQEAFTIQGQLQQDRKRVQNIESDASAAEKIYRRITGSTAHQEKSQIASDALFSAKLMQGDLDVVRSQAIKHARLERNPERRADRDDLGESDEVNESADENKSQGKVWSYGKAKWVRKSQIRAEEDEATMDYDKLRYESDDMRPSNIRKEAQGQAEEVEQNAAEAAALRALQEDENEEQVARRADDSMQLEGYLELQRQKINEVRNSERNEVRLLGMASNNMRQAQHEVEESVKAEEMLQRRAQSMKMTSTTADRDLGQGMGDDNQEQQFASHVADALASRLAKEGDMNAEERGHLVATVWREGNTMVSKEEQLVDEDRRYEREKADYAVRNKWNHGSLVDVYNVETGKWYHGTVLARHGGRVNIQFHHLGIREWLPDGSKRLRIPRDAVESNDGPLLGQSQSEQSDSTSDTAHLVGTMSQEQLHLVEAGLEHAHQDQKHVQKLVTSVSQKTDELRDFVKAHLLHRNRAVPIEPNDSSEYFIAHAANHENLGEDASSDMHDLFPGSRAGLPTNNPAGQGSTDLSLRVDLGESADVEARGGSHTPSEHKLAQHDAKALQEYTDHMQHDLHQDAKNKLLKMKIADEEKSAMQHEIIENAKVSKLARQAGTYQHLVAKSLKTLRDVKRTQLQHVTKAAAAGVWSSYQASLHVKEVSLRAKLQNLNKNLQQEEMFRLRIQQHASTLADEASQVRHVAESEGEVNERLGEVSSVDQVSLNLKAEDQDLNEFEKAAEKGINLYQTSRGIAA